MRKLIIPLLLLMHLSLLAQYPMEYSNDWKQSIEAQYRFDTAQYDFVLPPEEQMPRQPSLQQLQDAHWGNDWYGVTGNYSAIRSAAKGKVVVFIIDTAPKLDHPFLKDVAWNELGVSYTGEPIIIDGNGHGTHCAGIVGAKNGGQPLGLARMLADKGLLKIVPIEVLSDRGTGSNSNVAKGVSYAAHLADSLSNHGWFSIISMSLGSPSLSNNIESALMDAERAGAFIVAAAGNTYGEGLNYPGSSDYSHGIGSHNDRGARSAFSTYGEGLWMSGSGEDILSTYKGNTLAVLSGTSMATPSVAALVAIASSLHPGRSADEIRRMFENIATDMGHAGWDKEFGWGYVHTNQILSYRWGEPDPDPDHDPEPEDPTKDKESRGSRMMSLSPGGEFEVLYQTGGGKFKSIMVSDLIINFKASGDATERLSDVLGFCGQFFQNRVVTLRGREDAFDAGYWVGRFLEIYLRKEHGVRASVEHMVINDAGIKGHRTYPSFFDIFTKSRRSTFTY